MKLSHLTAIACLLASATFAATKPPLLLANPGFETDKNGDNMPDAWRFTWRATRSGEDPEEAGKHEPAWGWDRDICHSGQASIRCGVEGPQDDGVWTQEGIAIPDGIKALKVTAWCRAEDVAGGTANVALVFLGAEKKWLDADYSCITVFEDCDWTQFTGYAAVQAVPGPVENWA